MERGDSPEVERLCDIGVLLNIERGDSPEVERLCDIGVLLNMERGDSPEVERLCVEQSIQERREGDGRKEMVYLTTHSIHFILCHSDSERGNPLPPHGLLFPISSKGSIIFIIPKKTQDNTYHGLC